MRPELKAVVQAGGLTRTSNDAVFSHGGTSGDWSVSAGIIGMGPVMAREATARMLERCGPLTTSWWWALPAVSIRLSRWAP